MILALILLLLFPLAADAAKRLPRPSIGAPVGQAVAGGFAVDIKDCYATTPYTTAADTESSSGTIAKKTSGDHDDGQIACPVNVSADTYYAWLKVRLSGSTAIRDRLFWVNTSPFRAGFQNSTATLISPDENPPASFVWVPVGADLNVSTLVQTTTQTTFSLGSGSVLYLMGNATVEFDCIFLATADDATPICEAGAPATGITHNATGTAAAASATSTLTPTITVAAGSNKILLAGIAHRTSTNTISGVSSSVDGALTLVNWTNNGITGCAVYRLLEPTVGAHTVTVTFSSAQNGAAGLVAYNGVSQTAPVSTVSTGAGQADPSLSIASAVDQLVVDHLCVSVDNAETVTVDASQTQRWQKEVDITGGANRVSAFSEQQGDSSVAMTWAITGTRVWAHQAFALKPPSAAGSPPVLGTPELVSVGPTSATVRASIDDPSSTCEAEYDVDTGAPYANNTADVGATGGFCQVVIPSLTEGTPYFYRVNATNAQGTTNSSEGTFDTTTATAVTALGYTQAEIDIWNVRRVSGPYLDDWTRILANANSFVAAPNGAWPGQTTATCWAYPNTPGTHGNRDVKLRDSAFVYLLTGDTDYLNPVVTQLLAQAATAGTDFSNSARWCDSSVHFSISNWLRILLYAYDFIRHDISAGNRTTLDAWFLNAANWVNNFLETRFEARFPKRSSDDYSACATTPDNFSTGNCPGGTEGKLYFDGPTQRNFNEVWDNQGMTRMAFVTAAGVLLDNATLKASGLRAFQEWVKYGMFSLGQVQDEYRWNGSGNTSHGYAYPAATVASALTIADHLARSGDSSAYNYSSSDGMYGTEGGTKSLRLALLYFAGMSLGTVVEYASTVSTADTTKIIDATGPYFGGSSLSRAEYIWLSNNTFYNDATIKSAYEKAIPSSYQTSGYELKSGEWGVFPGVRFMFARMEGQVDPYP